MSSQRTHVFSLTDNTIWAKGFNDCNESAFRSGVNHVWIQWYAITQRFRIGLAKDGDEPYDIITLEDAKKTKKVGSEYKPKIQIQYSNRDGKPCTVTLEPCDDNKRITEYKKCMSPGEMNFTSQKEWVDKIMDWFYLKIAHGEAKLEDIPPKIGGKKPRKKIRKNTRRKNTKRKKWKVN